MPSSTPQYVFSFFLFPDFLFFLFYILRQCLFYPRLILNLLYGHGWLCTPDPPMLGVQKFTIYLVIWWWGWNPGPCGYSTSTDKTELHSQAIQVYCLIEKGTGLLRCSQAQGKAADAGAPALVLFWHMSLLLCLRSCQWPSVSYIMHMYESVLIWDVAYLVLMCYKTSRQHGHWIYQGETDKLWV